MTDSLGKATALTFEDVYEQHFDLVWSSIRRFGVTSEAMDDLVQEVFMVVHSKLSTLDNPEALRSWIYGIVRRKVSNHRRKQQSYQYSSVAVEHVPDHVVGRSPADLAEQNEKSRLLWMLLDDMDPNKREVFVMAELDELSCPEIAAALQIPLNTVYSRLRHARGLFEATLQRYNVRTGTR